MGRKPRVDRSPEEKWQIAQEGELFLAQNELFVLISRRTS
jgi:hypothetical protein